MISTRLAHKISSEVDETQSFEQRALTIEQHLPALLADAGVELIGANITHCDQHTELVFFPVGRYHVMMQRIHPSPTNKALLHPHTWPAFIRVYSGRCEMGFGFGPGENPPPLNAHVTVHASPENTLTHTMDHIDAWHYIRAIDGPVHTLMIAGRKWERWYPKSPNSLNDLSAGKRSELWKYFQQVHHARVSREEWRMRHSHHLRH